MSVSTDFSSMKVSELKEEAQKRGIKGVSGLRKGDLIAALEAGGTQSTPSKKSAPKSNKSNKTSSKNSSKTSSKNSNDSAESETPQTEQAAKRRVRRIRVREQGNTETFSASAAENAVETNSANNRTQETQEASENPRNNRRKNSQEKNENNQQNSRNGSRNNSGNDSRNDAEERRRNRRNRRDRNNRRNGNGQGDDNRSQEQQNQEPATYSQITGILDIIDSNTAFIRTQGYQFGPDDVYVPINMVRKNSMRKGDVIQGKIKDRNNNNNNGRNRQRQKYQPLASVDLINGMTPEEAQKRPEFAKLTPLYPNQRLRLETDQKTLTTRVIDLVMPIGKGQRALIVSPPKAGKTTILQDIANAIKVNNPEAHLMVVLVDERPEEVTDMQRSVKGEVISSTFDRPPSEHTTVAELAIERAKRLVEQGEDVVVLLDSITRLGRAYNNSSPASGRILSGGVDSNALYPPKRFLGAARNIENGGSLTIIATAMVETGSAGDTVIFEEFKGTGNAELKLDRKIAERRVFPAVDVNPSGTRKDELLLAPEEARIMQKFRRILSALDNQQAIDTLIKQLRKTKNNKEFLLQLASSAPLATGDQDGDEYEY